MSANPLRLRELLGRLVEAEISFVLVGGLAVNAWGYMRATQDVDVVPNPDAESLAKLDELLRDLGGKVDVLQGLPQVPRYRELKEKAVQIDLDGLSVWVCSLQHLIAIKRASDRTRDQDDLQALEAAHEERGTED